MVELLAPDELEDALAGGRKVVIEAWAPACGACYQVAHLLEIAALEFPGLDFYRLDVRDAAAEGAVARLGIRVAPTVVLFVEGAERRRLEDPCGAGDLWALFSDATGG